MADSEKEIFDYEDKNGWSDIEVVPNSVEERDDDDFDYYDETDETDESEGEMSNTSTDRHVLDLPEDVNFSSPESSGQ